MAFTERLARLRQAQGLTQKDLAARVGLNQAQIHRYEKGAAEPSMSALKRLALALDVTIDELVFDDGERGPDDDLRLQFDAVSQFPPEEKRVAKELLDPLIIGYTVFPRQQLCQALKLHSNHRIARNHRAITGRRCCC